MWNFEVETKYGWWTFLYCDNTKDPSQFFMVDVDRDCNDWKDWWDCVMKKNLLSELSKSDLKRAKKAIKYHFTPPK
jgi:hypothetical protein